MTRFLDLLENISCIYKDYTLNDMDRFSNISNMCQKFFKKNQVGFIIFPYYDRSKPPNLVEIYKIQYKIFQCDIYFFYRDSDNTLTTLYCSSYTTYKDQLFFNSKEEAELYYELNNLGGE